MKTSLLPSLMTATGLTLFLAACDSGMPPPMVRDSQDYNYMPPPPEGGSIEIPGDSSAPDDFTDLGPIGAPEPPQNSGGGGVAGSPEPPTGLPPSSPPPEPAPPPMMDVHPLPPKVDIWPGFFGGVLRGEYANEKPNYGDTINSYSLEASFDFDPFDCEDDWDDDYYWYDQLMGRKRPEPWWHYAFINVQAGYSFADPAAFSTVSYNFGVSAIFYQPHFRFGPALGFQSNSTGGYATQTWNYGAFVEWFVRQRLSLFAKLGGFSGNNHSDGLYAGGSMQYFLTRDLNVRGGIDYTHWSSFGGRDEFDYTIQGEYLISEDTPVSIFGGYTRSNFSGGFDSNTFFAGLKLYVNGNAVRNLIARQHMGDPPPRQFKF